jgi:hypothetical protein
MTDLLTLAEAKTALNITVTTYDTELADYITAATEAVNFICGDSTSTAVTFVTRASGAIAVSDTPILSLTSVTGDWSGVRDLTLLRFDAYTGVIRPKATALPLADDTYTVVYQRGRAAVPTAMKQAAKVILKHQWSTQRGPQAKATNSDGTFIPGLGYAVPNAALEMLGPNDRGPAVG